jgi:hypothetical protein
MTSPTKGQTTDTRPSATSPSDRRLIASPTTPQQNSTLATKPLESLAQTRRLEALSGSTFAIVFKLVLEIHRPGRHRCGNSGLWSTNGHRRPMVRSEEGSS